MCLRMLTIYLNPGFLFSLLWELDLQTASHCVEYRSRSLKSSRSLMAKRRLRTWKRKREREIKKKGKRVTGGCVRLRDSIVQNPLVRTSNETELHTNQHIERRAFPRRIRVCWSVNRRVKQDLASNDPNAGRSCSPTCCSRCTTRPPSARFRICNEPSELSIAYLA